jgi:hypothetical protein
MSTRRKFLVNCSTVALTASIVPASVLGRTIRFKEHSLEAVRFSDFASQLNTVFQLQVESGPPVRLQLVEARKLIPAQSASVKAEDAENEKFSLLFRGLLKQPLEQGSYLFEHQRIGRFPMFIVPIGTMRTGGAYYEAIFNRPLNGRFPKAGEGTIPVGRANNTRRRVEQGSNVNAPN